MYTVIMGHLGTDAVAANSIANIVKDLLVCLSLGLGNAGGNVFDECRGLLHFASNNFVGFGIVYSAFELVGKESRGSFAVVDREASVYLKVGAYAGFLRQHAVAGVELQIF